MTKDEFNKFLEDIYISEQEAIEKAIYSRIQTERTILSSIGGMKREER